MYLCKYQAEICSNLRIIKSYLFSFPPSRHMWWHPGQWMAIRPKHLDKNWKHSTPTSSHWLSSPQLGWDHRMGMIQVSVQSLRSRESLEITIEMCHQRVESKELILGVTWERKSSGLRTWEYLFNKTFIQRGPALHTHVAHILIFIKNFTPKFRCVIMARCP